MPQTPVSANVFVNSATPLTIYTAPAGRTAIVNNVQVASLLGSNFSMTLNKVSASGVVYPIAVNRNSGDDVNFFTTNTTSANAPMNALKGSITLAENESISISTTTVPAFKFPRTTTGNGVINQVTYTNGRYVAVGRNGDTSRGLVLTSTDGQNWTSQTFTVTATLLDVAGNNSTRLIAISTTLSNGFFISNDNGVTWTQLNNLTGGHSGAPVAIEFINNLWVMVGPNYFYTSVDGTTWTINAAFTTYLGTSNPALTNVTHDGTRYIFSCRNCAPIYSTDLATFFNTGSVRFGSQAIGIAHAPSSNRFYAAFGATAAADYLSTSTDGLNWSRVTGITAHPVGASAPMYYPTAAGGTSQSVMMQRYDYVYGFVSTDGGTTWASYDRNSAWTAGNYAVQPAMGLGNGYYFIYRDYDDGGGNYYSQGMTVTTTPNTASPAGVQLQGSRLLYPVVASTGVQGGPFVVFGRWVDNGTLFHHYTANPATGWNNTPSNSSISSVPIVGATYGLGKFWAVGAVNNTTARIFSIDPAAPSVLTFVTTVTTSGYPTGMSFINGRLCVYVNNSETINPVVHTSTDGVNWATLPIQNAGQNTSLSVAAAFRNATSPSITINCTDMGQVISSTDADNWYSIPHNFINIQSVNGNIIAINRTPNSTPARYYGSFRITNPTVVTGYTQVNQQNPGTSYTNLPNFVTFSNGSYFFSGGNNIGIMTSLSGSIVGGSISSTAINGQIFLNSMLGSYAVASAGSGMVIADARPTSGSTWSLGWVPDINVARSVAACSASILEIS